MPVQQQTADVKNTLGLWRGCSSSTYYHYNALCNPLSMRNYSITVRVNIMHLLQDRLCRNVPIQIVQGKFAP